MIQTHPLISLVLTMYITTVDKMSTALWYDFIFYLSFKQRIKNIFFFFQAIIAHHSEKPSELELKVGDHVAVAGNHWDGYSKGRNLRTNQVGLYPSFKVKNRNSFIIVLFIHLM